MKIRVKQATIVKPAEETPKHSLWLSNLDLIQVRFHMGIIYLYNPCSSSNLPNTQSLIEALSKVLVLFYPAAGRLQKGKDSMKSPQIPLYHLKHYFLLVFYISLCFICGKIRMGGWRLDAMEKEFCLWRLRLILLYKTLAYSLKVWISLNLYLLLTTQETSPLYLFFSFRLAFLICLLKMLC